MVASTAREESTTLASQDLLRVKGQKEGEEEEEVVMGAVVEQRQKAVGRLQLGIIY